MGNDDSAGREFDEGCNCQTIRFRPRGQKECRLGYPTRCKANMAPLRIACFHSFRMSSGCLRKQMSEFSNFAASLGEQVEFRYLDGPHRCPPEKEAQMPERLKTLLPPPYFEWWNARESDDGAVSYDGEAATLAHVTDFMQREGTSPARAPPAPLCLRTSAPPHLSAPGPFDGVLGFSQGGSLAHLLCMVQEHDKAHKHGQSVVSVVPQLAVSATWDAGLWAWAALCSLEKRSDPSGGIRRRRQACAKVDSSCASQHPGPRPACLPLRYHTLGARDARPRARTAPRRIAPATHPPAYATDLRRRRQRGARCDDARAA